MTICNDGKHVFDGTFKTPNRSLVVYFQWIRIRVEDGNC